LDFPLLIYRNTTNFCIFSCILQPCWTCLIVQIRFCFVAPLGFSLYNTISSQAPVILATWESEIRRIMVGGKAKKIVHETPISKNNQSKMDWRCGVSGRAPEALSPNPSPIKNKSKNKRPYHLLVKTALFLSIEEDIYLFFLFFIYLRPNYHGTQFLLVTGNPCFSGTHSQAF
jgi:hypothetical protein